MKRLVFFLFLTLCFFEETTLAVELDVHNSSGNLTDIRVQISPPPSNQHFFPTTLHLNSGSNIRPIPDIEANSTVKIYHNREVMCQKTYSTAPSNPQLTIVPGGTICILQ